MIKKIGKFVSDALDFNEATLSGCIDIVVTEKPDGTLDSSPFHIRFGKLKVLKSKEKEVRIYVNDNNEAPFRMKLDKAGEAYFEYKQGGDDDDDIGSSDPDDFLSSEDEDSKQNSPNITGQSGKNLPVSPMNMEKKELEYKESGSLQKDSEKKEKKGWFNWRDKEKKEDSEKKKTKEELKTIEHSHTTDLATDDFQLDVDMSSNSQLDPKKTLNHSTTSTAESEQPPKKGIIRSFIGLFSSDTKDKNKKNLEVKDEPKQQGSGQSSPRPSEIKTEEVAKNEQQMIDDQLRERRTKSENIDYEKNQNQARKETEEFYEEMGGDFFMADSPDKISKKKKQPPPEIKVTEDPEQDQVVEEMPPEEEGDITLSLCGDQIIGAPDEQILPVFLKNRVPFNTFAQDPKAVLGNPNLMVKIEDKLYDWSVASPLIVSLLAFKKPLPDDIIDKMCASQMEKSSWRDWFNMSKKKNEEKQRLNNFIISPKAGDLKSTSDSSNLKSPPPDDINHDEEFYLEEAERIGESKILEEVQEELDPNKVVVKTNKTKKKLFKKSLRPTSEQLKQLNLKPGMNTVVYSVSSALRGIQKVHGFIYLWPANAKIVISDVDGTITRSDVLGQVLPYVGKDWSHIGVTSLYTSMVKNGYKILYLTARAIGQSAQTRNYLTSLQQDGSSLPLGPIIMSPDRLLYSFKREVILRRPEVFKIACLREIKNIFPENHNPFYAGFGNRETDGIAYRAVGIQPGKIFIINPQGDIHQINNTYKKSYTLLNDMVDAMFPPVNEEDQDPEKEEYNSVNYFRMSSEHLADLEEIIEDCDINMKLKK